MLRGLSIAATGMHVFEKGVENTAHTLANSSTTAFKKMMLVAKSIMPQTLNQAGSLSSSTGNISNVGAYFGGGAQVAATIPVLTQGVLTQTGRDTDLAVLGNGYFQVELPDGTIGYTRDGTFNRGADGTIETVEGYKVVPGITVPETTTSLMISKNGEVEAKLAGQTENQNLGQIQLAIFTNPTGLQPISGNIFTETAASGAAIIGNPTDAGYGRLAQFNLENSNGDAVTEVTNLIKYQRGYELCAKAAKTEEEMAGILNSRIGV